MRAKNERYGSTSLIVHTMLRMEVAGEPFCTSCGAQLARGSRFCEGCGAVSPASDRPEGRQVGRFLLGQIIGHGGMGVVHRARDADLGRDVAVKLIAPSLAGDPDFRARFEAEARAAAAVDHPNVLPVFEAGEDGGELYLAMRFVEGTDLKAVLARESPLPPARAARIVAQIASALDAAHVRNLVHRDVKPANVLISDSAGSGEHVYLTDFGLTRIAGTSGHLTNPGQVVGTANYIAPEQIEGRPIDGRVDVYALACVAFECLTGDPPFARETAAATLAAHLHDEIPAASRRVSTLPPDLDDALAGGLAKSPAHRFASCGAFARALGAALGIDPGKVPADPRAAARARAQRATVPTRARLPMAPEPSTAVLERPAHGSRLREATKAVVFLLALGAIGSLIAAAIMLAPSLLASRGGGGQAAPTLRVLTGVKTVNGNLSTLMSRLARDPADEAERKEQSRELPALREKIHSLLAATHHSVEPSLRRLVLRALTAQQRLLDEYGRVLDVTPADAQTLIDEMLRTLGRVETDLRNASQAHRQSQR